MIYHKKRPVLYVDDTVEQRYAMRRILETEGFSVLEAGSGKEALELLEQQPALAVVDVRLPDISGYELSRRLKELTPHLQVLQVSASFSDPMLRAAGLSGGADAYLAQPVYPAELVTLVRRMLRTAEADEALRILARVGARASQSLSVAETAQNICDGVVPWFADECRVFVERIPGQPPSLFPAAIGESDELANTAKAHSNSTGVQMIHSRMIVAPLFDGKKSLGCIGFRLNDDREYTETDFLLAQDIANRAALALQNCILFASEQLTRAALVQSEKLATAGRMAAAIAHEINNPLEALTNLIYILEHSPEATAPIRDLANAALAEVSRIAHITRQTLGFYRDLRTPATLNLAHDVTDALKLYERRFAEKQVAIELRLDETLKITGVKGEIRQVISNLLTNALEAMEPEGIMSVSVFAEAEWIVVSIADNGPGIKEDVIAKIFDPFFSTKQGTGTGLGLWIAKTIVEKHSGEIRVSTIRDATNHGTEFEVRFPRAPRE